MQAHIKNKDTLIVNTIINDLEKPELLEYISNLKDISFYKLYDINGEVSGIALYGGDSDTPLVSVYKGVSAVISFGITDNDGNVITMNDIKSLILTCRKDKDSSEIIFTKYTSDFRYKDNFSLALNSEDTNIDSGEYFINVECITDNYKDNLVFTLKVIGSD